jgi:outer membrane protein TolC
MRSPALVLLVAAAGCATPPDRLESAQLAPVPRVAGAGPSAPAVLPTQQLDAANQVLADLRSRGRAGLADCIRLAEATNEALLSGDEDRLQAALAGDVAIASLLPQLSTSVIGFVEDRVPDSGSGGSGSSFSTSSSRSQWALTVRQPIFRGFSEWRSIEAASRSEEARAAGVESLRNALGRSVARAFYGVLAAEADVRTLEEAEKLDRSRVEEMQARLESGVARRSELLLVETRLQTTLGALRRARTSRDVTRTTLDELLGVTLPVPIADAPPQTLAAIPSRDAALAEALRKRPDLRAASLQSDAAQAEIGVVRAEYWPTLALAANEYIARSGYPRSQKATDWDAQFTLDFPFFEGGATKARERVARSEVRKTRLAESRLVRGAVQDVEETLAKVAADDELLAALERNMQIASENLVILREEFRNGVATNLEVLTAQNVLQQAQLDVERQRLENRLDRIELSLALGRTEIVP